MCSLGFGSESCGHGPWDQASLWGLDGSARQLSERRAGPARVHAPVRSCVNVSVSERVYIWILDTRPCTGRSVEEPI